MNSPQELILRDYQNDCLSGLRSGFAEKHRCQMLYLGTGGGKCLGKGTLIIMSDGTIKSVENIVSGDKLLGVDGTIRNVLSTHSGLDNLYRVNQKKGDSYIVNGEHILSLRTTLGKSTITLPNIGTIKGDGGIVNVSVTDYLSSNKTAKHCLKGWKVEAVEFCNEAENLEIPAYILGVWLGDGRSDSPVICKPDGAIIEAWKDYASSIEMSVSEYKYGDKCSNWGITNGKNGGADNKLLTLLRKYNLINNKHIPDRYKYASIKNRLELIAGLIDTDGHIHHGGYDWISKYENLANDFTFMCRSVGLSARITQCKKGIASTGFIGEYWRVSISGDCEKIPCKQKISITRSQKKRHLVNGIEICPLGTGEYFGFEIDGDNLFLLGDFTVTHNSELAIKLSDLAQQKGTRTAIISDRRVLVNQLSERFDKYGIAHGVQMAGHDRRDPSEPIQLCSAQTLEAYGSMPYFSLMVIDEAHRLRKSLKNYIENNPTVKVIGLSASPFTKGLGQVFSNVVSKITTKELIEKKQLVPIRAFIATEIDMTGAKKIGGEWSDKETSDRGIKIVGDVVSEWQKRTMEIYGEPRKTIIFCAGVAHGMALSKEFARAGYNFVSVSYKDEDEFKQRIISEFKKPLPESGIHGLIATNMLTEGFDCSDVVIGVMARPFSKSLSSVEQQLGRLRRPFPGKEFAIINDHSGNFLRFQEELEDLYENGVSHLDDGKEKSQKEPSIEEKERAKCPKCGCVWESKGDTCSHCGHVRVRRNEVISVPGEMTEIQVSKKSHKIEKQQLYWEIVNYARRHSLPENQRGRAANIYRDIVGVWPRFGFDDTPIVPISLAVLNKIKSNNIAFAKRK